MIKKMNRKNEKIKISAEFVFLFDLDGTLVDTNHSNFLAYKKAIQSVIKSDPDLAYFPEKRFCRSDLINVVPNLTEAEYKMVIQEKEAYFCDFLYETNLIKKNFDILTKYSKTNKTILVTNCRKNRALATLNHFGITEKFSNFFFREFSENGKKINKFQNAMSKLGIPPDIVIAFENEELEITDAIHAGIKYINPIID
jgi:beta-phosphoglucomutase